MSLTRSRRQTIRTALALTIAALALSSSAPAANTPTQTTGSGPQPAAKKPARHLSNEQIIRQVFGRYGDQAVRVAYCESRLSIWARNGQYLGMFQHGAYARSRFGFAWNAWVQARAAYAYFKASGYSWAPWTCKPW